jgi:phage gpG-like protein
MTPNFQEVAKQLSKLIRNFPIAAANEAVNYFVVSFDREAWEGKSWEKRKANFLEKSSSRRNLLVKSGRLRRSIRRVANSVGYARVATDVPYAKIHNEGGTIIQTPTAKQRAFFSHVAEGFFDSKNDPNKWAEGHKFISMSKAKQLTINLPQRQFMGDSQQLNNLIKQKMDGEFRKIIESVKK